MPSDHKIVVVCPTIRPESHAQFVKAWTPLFEKHKVTLITVWDGDQPEVQVKSWPRNVDDGRRPYSEYNTQGQSHVLSSGWLSPHRDLFCTRTDACRNIGFVYAAKFLDFTHVLTLDDDVMPCGNTWEYDAHDPIQAHLGALDRRVPLGWMNTSHDTDLYLRGVPYGVRTEAPVMLSHGVWVGTPDFDGETQLRLETQNRSPVPDGLVVGVPHSLPYYVGPVPRGVLFPLCGMNVMVKTEALPYLYFAPMGADSGVPDLHRMADIFMGCMLKRKFDELGWACVTGYSTIHHTRASDARKNMEQERLGREWMECTVEEWESGIVGTVEMSGYFKSYADKRTRYEALVRGLLEKGSK